MMTKEEQVPEDLTILESAGWPLLQLELQKIERQQGQGAAVADGQLRARPDGKL